MSLIVVKLRNTDCTLNWNIYNLILKGRNGSESSFAQCAAFYLNGCILLEKKSENFGWMQSAATIRSKCRPKRVLACLFYQIYNPLQNCKRSLIRKKSSSECLNAAVWPDLFDAPFNLRITPSTLNNLLSPFLRWFQTCHTGGCPKGGTKQKKLEKGL